MLLGLFGSTHVEAGAISDLKVATRNLSNTIRREGVER